MSAGATRAEARTAPAPLDLDNDAIKLARQLLAEGRGVRINDPDETRIINEGLRDPDRIKVAVLRELLKQVEGKEASKIASEAAQRQIDALARHQERVRTRPSRWAELDSQQRAAFVVAAEYGGSVGRAFLRFVELMREPTETGTPPESFEPENIR